MMMIEFLIANWLIFLLVAIAGYVLAVGLQLWNIKYLSSGEVEGIMGRFGLVAFFGFIGSGSGIMFLISIILNAIEHFSV